MKKFYTEHKHNVWLEKHDGHSVIKSQTIKIEEMPDHWWWCGPIKLPQE